MKRKSLNQKILKGLIKLGESSTELTKDFIYAFDRPSSLFHRLLELSDFTDSEKSYERFYAGFNRLKTQKIIETAEKNGKTIIYLTEKGKKRLLSYKLDELKIEKPKVWDKKWRIAVFDIPEKKKIAREILRKKFRELGFYRIQDSVWVHPYDVSNLVEFLKNIYEIGPCVKLIEAESISDDEKIRDEFNLK